MMRLKSVARINDNTCSYLNGSYGSRTDHRYLKHIALRVILKNMAPSSVESIFSDLRFALSLLYGECISVAEDNAASLLSRYDHKTNSYEDILCVPREFSMELDEQRKKLETTVRALSEAGYDPCRLGF